MSHQVTVSRIESISEETTVHHFDELPDGVKDGLSRLVTDERKASIDAETASALTCYDVIKFTDYVRVSAE